VDEATKGVLLPSCAGRIDFVGDQVKQFPNTKLTEEPW